jgi:hypothetical protein
MCAIEARKLAAMRVRTATWVVKKAYFRFTPHYRLCRATLGRFVVPMCVCAGVWSSCSASG